MRPVLIGAILAVAIAAPPAGADAAAPATSSPCVPKVVTIDGHKGLALCGPATAVVHAGGKTYAYTHGFCATFGKGIFQLALGTSVPLATNDADRTYFSVNVGPATPHASGFAYDAGRKVIPAGSWTVSGDVTSHASFSAGAAHGSWNCHGVVATS